VYTLVSKVDRVIIQTQSSAPSYPFLQKLFCCCTIQNFGQILGWIYAAAASVFGVISLLLIFAYLVEKRMEWDEERGKIFLIEILI